VSRIPIRRFISACVRSLTGNSSPV
jgi:hypothetical protein